MTTPPPIREAAATWEPIDSLVPWESNPRDNSAAVSEVAKSIERFGFASPIICRSADRMIIAGHTRARAAKRLGIDKVPVRFLDLDPADAKLLALADNKLGEIADWDDESLAQVLLELRNDDADLLLSGFDQSEIDKLIDPPLEDVDPQLGDLEYRVVVDCDNEAEQARALDLLRAEGFECQSLMS